MAELSGELERLNGMVHACKLIEASEQAEADLLFSNDPQNVEHRALLARANIGSIFAAVIEHSATSGAEAELQAGIRHRRQSDPARRASRHGRLPGRS